MRKIYLPWMIMVFGIFGTSYGAYLLAYHFKYNNKLSSGALVLLIFGLIALAFSIALAISIYLSKKKKKKEVVTPIKEEVKEEVVVKQKEDVPVKESLVTKPEKKEYVPKTQRTSYSSSSSHSYSTVYVKQVGYGPLLRIEGNRILDMRTNTYYRIDNNLVYQEGSGPVFEIRGNQIKSAFGGYLYELSGNNINKVFGGFYASISGNYITLYDLSIKYEVTDSLTKRQILVASALLFGKY